jgi:hypothetical protein
MNTTFALIIKQSRTGDMMRLLGKDVMGLLKWIFSLFWASNPKQLPLAETILDDKEANLLFTDEGLQTIQQSNLDDLDRMVLELDTKQTTFEEAARKKIRQGDFFKKAFQKQIEYISEPTGTDIIMAHHLKLPENEFHIFADEFLKICSDKGIHCSKYSSGNAVEIEKGSFIKYVERCKEEARNKPITISKGPYR